MKIITKKIDAKQPKRKLKGTWKVEPAQAIDFDISEEAVKEIVRLLKSQYGHLDTKEFLDEFSTKVGEEDEQENNSRAHS